MKVSRVQILLLPMIALVLPACDADERHTQDDARKVTIAGKVTVAAVQSKPATITDSYECRVESEGRAFVRSPIEGRVTAILVKEGQAVKRGDPLFKVEPDRDELKSPAKDRDRIVSIEAPCNGSVLGFRGPGPVDPVGKGTHVLTLGDDSVMRVRFVLPEKHYLAFMKERGLDWRNADLHLILADHGKYPHTGKIVEVLAGIHNETGDVTFMAEFPNPDGVLRRGQTGTLLRKRVVKDAILLIPRRAMFEGPYSWKRFVYVVDKDHVAHRREIVIEDGAGDMSVIEKGVGVGEWIVVDGVGQVSDGDKVDP